MEAPNGNSSVLFKNLSKTFKEEDALTLWSASYSEVFNNQFWFAERDVNGEHIVPTINTFLIQENNKVPLTKKSIIEMQEEGVKNLAEVTNRKDVKQFIENGNSLDDINGLLSNSEMSNVTDENGNLLHEEEFIHNVIEQTFSTTKEEFLEKVSKIGNSQLRAEVESNADVYFEISKNYEQIDVVDENLDDVVENSTLEKLNNGIVLGVSNVALSNNIDFIKNLNEEEQFNKNTYPIIEFIQEKAAEIGIDLSGVVTKFKTKRFEDSVEFFNALDKFSTDAYLGNRVDVETFATAYNTYFDIEEDGFSTVLFKDDVGDRNLLKIKTTLSENELFTRQNVIRVEGDVYHKLSTLDVVSPTKEHLEKAQETGLLPNIIALKEQYGYKLVDEDKVQRVSEIAENETYLTGKFIPQFNVEIIKEKHKNSVLYNKVLRHFNISDKGITLKPYVGNSVKADINFFTPKEGIYRKLREYSTLSKELNGLFPQEQIKEVSKEIQRTAYINTPNILPLFTGEYLISEQGNLKIQNSFDDFIRIGKQVYEAMERHGNTTFYAPLRMNENTEFFVKAKAPSNIKNETFLNTTQQENVLQTNKMSKSEKALIEDSLSQC